jgi:hypothetical protein
VNIKLYDIFGALQRQLFPSLTEELGDLTDKDRQYVEVMALVALHAQPFLSANEWCGEGRPPQERCWILHAFIAKAVYNFPTTRALIDALVSRPTLRRLCGFESPNEVPKEWTFSRAFADFARDGLPQKVHEAMVVAHLGPEQKLVGHVSRDSTAIEGAEKPAPKAQPEAVQSVVVPAKRGRPRQGEFRPEPEPKRLDLQLGRSLAENLAELPTVCNVGCKRNSQGHQESWIGFKLHLDTVDGDIPVSACLTSASLHDSQAAIPLAQMTAARVRSLYDLMDSAYDAEQIRTFSRQLGHVPIIDPNPRSGEAIPLDPAQQQRFKERSSAERVNSNLKDNFGGRTVRVRGGQKVMCHLMFGVVALAATQLFKLLGLG